MKVPWDIFWQSQPWKGKVGLLDDYRDGLRMPMQRDAMRDGPVPDLNTEDAAIIAKAGRDLAQLTNDLQHQGRRSPTTRRCPRARPGCTTRGRATSSAPRCTTCRRASTPDVLSFWGPEESGVVQNDFLFITRRPTKPALAHAFLNFLLDEKNAYENFVQFTGYTPPQNTSTPRRWSSAG